MTRLLPSCRNLSIQSWESTGLSIISAVRDNVLVLVASWWDYRLFDVHLKSNWVVFSSWCDGHGNIVVRQIVIYLA